jgi:CysZ protein
MNGAGVGEGRPALAGARAPKQGRPRGVFAGLRYPWRGARFVYFEHKGLMRFWLPPVLITCALLIAAVYGALSLHAGVSEALWSTPGGSGFAASLQRFAHGLFEWLVALVLLAVGVVAVALLSSVIAAPFNDALSEAVESIECGRAAPRFSLRGALRDVVRGVALEALKLAGYAGVMLGLFLVGLLLPGVGTVLQSVVSAGLTALFLALDHVDWAASRAGLDARARLAFARRNLPTMLGFGAGVWVLLLLPFVNLLFMPAAVAGGTLLFLELGDQQGNTRSS